MASDIPSLLPTAMSEKDAERATTVPGDEQELARMGYKQELKYVKSIATEGHF